MTPRDVRYIVSSLPMQAGLVPVGTPAPPPPPTPVAALEGVPGTMVVGIQATAQVHNTGTVPATWGIGTGTGLAVSPSTGTLAAGAVQALTLDATIANAYTLTLTVTGGTGGTASITANPGAVAPVPSFIGAPAAGTVPFTTTFTNQSTGVYSSLLWDFGDGSTSTSANPTHAYTVAGTYTVTLTLNWAGAPVTFTRTAYITANAAPTATALTLSLPSSGTTGVPVTVTVTPNNPIPVGGGTVTLTRTGVAGGVLGTSALTFTAGSSAAQSTTLNHVSDGTSTITMANTMGLSNTGSGSTYTSTTTVIVPGVIKGFAFSASAGSLPFALGVSFAKGAIPSGQSVVVSGATARAAVINRWPDNSVKFALVGGTYTSAGSVVPLTFIAGTVAAGSALTGASVQTAMGANTAVINCGAFGTATFIGTDFAAPFITHAATDLFAEFVYRKQVGSDPHLAAWLAVRLWASGQVETLPWLENGYLSVASPTSKSATYTYTLGGVLKFNGAIDLPSFCRTPLVNGSLAAHWLGTDPGVTAYQEVGSLQSSGMVPAYSAITPISAASVTGLPATWSPLSNGSFPVSGLGGVGGNDYVGLLPEWDVVHITTGGTVATAKAVSFNGYAAGRYPIYRREDPTFATVGDRFLWPRLSNHPTLDAGSLTVAAGTAAPAYSGDHQPMMGYMAYLMTGRRYHLDTVQAETWTDTFQGLGAGGRQNGLGIRPSQVAGSVRGAAWAWRNLAAALAIAPDSTIANEYRTQFKNNVDYYWSRYVGAGGYAAPVGNKQGFVQPYSSYTLNSNGPSDAGSTTTSIKIQGISIGYGVAADGQWIGQQLYNYTANEARTVTAYVAATNTFTVSPGFSAAPSVGTTFGLIYDTWWNAPWMHDYFTAAVGFSKDIGAGLDNTTQARLDEFFKWQAQSIVGRLGLTGSTEFLFRDWALYCIPVCKFDYGSSGYDTKWDTGGTPSDWFADWGEIYAKTYSGRTVPDNGQAFPFAPRAKVDGPLRSDGYGGDPYAPHAITLPAIAYAVKHGVPGALRGYGLLLLAGNAYLRNAVLDPNPINAVAPQVMPAWRRGAPSGQWVEVQGTAVTSVSVSHTARLTSGTGSAGAPWLDAYTGAGVDLVSGRIKQLGNGGHGDYYGNEVLDLNLFASVPAWAEQFWGSQGNVINSPIAAPTDLYYLDDGISGRLPPAAHTYYGQWPIHRHGRMIRSGDYSISPTGSGCVDTDSFSLTSAQGVNAWGVKGEYPGSHVSGYTGINEGVAGTIATGMCADSRYDKLYLLTTGGRVFTPSLSGPNGTVGSGGSWAPMVATGDPGFANNGPACAFDTRRGKILAFFAGGSSAWVYDADGGTGWTTATLTGPALSLILAAGLGTSHGMTYVPALDSYLVRMGPGGASVIQIHPTTFACTLLSVTGGGGIPPTSMKESGGSVLPGNYEGVYNKFQYVPALRCVIYPLRNSSNCWALPVE